MISVSGVTLTSIDRPSSVLNVQIWKPSASIDPNTDSNTPLNFLLRSLKSILLATKPSAISKTLTLASIPIAESTPPGGRCLISVSGVTLTSTDRPSSVSKVHTSPSTETRMPRNLTRSSCVTLEVRRPACPSPRSVPGCSKWGTAETEPAKKRYRIITIEAVIANLCVVDIRFYPHLRRRIARRCQ